MNAAPRLLDAYCGAGGASVGYARAGFQVVGIDIKPQKNYPFSIFVGDALKYLADRSFLSTFDAIHCSPPCQRYSLATPHANRINHPDLLPPTRALLQQQGAPWVIENVPGAPMRADVVICGCQVGLELRRKRWFETSWHHFEMRPGCAHDGPVVSVVGHGTPSWVRQMLGYNPTIHQYRAAMGIDWMNRNELSEAIPPAYTEWLGARLLEQLEVVG